MKDTYRIVRNDFEKLRFEVQRLWQATNEFVGCFKAETLQDCNDWIKERQHNKEKREDDNRMWNMKHCD